MERNFKLVTNIYLYIYQWYVENFLEPYFVLKFIETSYVGIKTRGMHKAAKDMEKAIKM